MKNALNLLLMIAVAYLLTLAGLAWWDPASIGASLEYRLGFYATYALLAAPFAFFWGKRRVEAKPDPSVVLGAQQLGRRAGRAVRR